MLKKVPSIESREDDIQHSSVSVAALHVVVGKAVQTFTYDVE